MRVIDVSEHNGTIDWEAVKAAGIQGAIIRCGYGMDMPSQDDKQWSRNVSECERLGIPYGVYLYSYADNADKARSEAQHVLRLIKGRKLSFPVYYDLEQEGIEGAAVANAKIFGDMIESAGYWCGVYYNKDWHNRVIKGRLDSFTLWGADYGSNNGQMQEEYKPGFGEDMWQYTSNGKVNGISGNVDMNECYRDFPAEISGVSTADTDTALEQDPGERAYKENRINYRVHQQSAGWLPHVEDGQVAGVTGHAKRIEAIKIDCKMEGVKLYAKGHIQGEGWKDYEMITSDTIIGTTGQEKRLEAISLEAEGLPEGMNIYVRYHIESEGWSNWIKGGTVAGTVGLGKRLEAIQIKIQ